MPHFTDGQVLTAAQLNAMEADTDAVAADLATHAADTTTHGTSGDVVGTSDTQTLTNKTLTAPKLNENVAVTASATEVNILDGATLSTAELNFVDGVTSAIQTQLDAKAAAADLTTHAADTTTHGTAGDIVGTSDTQTLTNKTLTAPKINENVAVTATATELNYTDGVTSAIQTQLDAMVEKAGDTMTGALTINGTASPLSVNGTTAGFFLQLAVYAASAFGPITEFFKSRNATIGQHTVVQSGDTLGTYRFWGSDGDQFVEAVAIRAEVGGTPGDNDMPGRLVFATTADGGTSPTNRLTIAANGTATFANEVEIDGALNHDGTTVGFYGTTPATQPAANPDTSGATLAALETEVNQIKAALRSLGIIAT